MPKGKPFKKGEGGRPPGAVNKSTKLVKEVFAKVFGDLQNNEADKWTLKNWAQENPTEFYKLASKLIPVQMTGQDGKAIEHIHEVVFKHMDGND